MNKKQPTTFSVDPKLWLEFERKRLEDIDPTKKYGSMNKSRIINGLLEDLVNGKINIDLTSPIKTKEAVIQGVHLKPEVKYKLDAFLLKEKKKFMKEPDKAKEVDKMKNVITKLLKWYVA